MNEDRAQPAAAASHAVSEPAPPAIDRRALLRGGLSLGGAALLGGALAPASSQALALTDAQPGFDPSLPEKFRDPQWNRDAFARLQGSLKFGEVKSGWYAGTVHGVVDGQAVKPLMGFEGFSKARLIDRGDGSYQKVLREVLFYTDLQTGEVLETYRNPYTDEQVPVVHIANDPFNMLIEQYRPKGPTYGGLNKPDEQRAPPAAALEDHPPEHGAAVGGHPPLLPFRLAAGQMAPGIRRADEPGVGNVPLCHPPRGTGRRIHPVAELHRLLEPHHPLAALDADGAGAGPHLLFGRHGRLRRSGHGLAANPGLCGEALSEVLRRAGEVGGT